MSNIIKGFLLVIFLLALTKGQAQKLMDTQSKLNLGAGDVVHDVEYLEEAEIYVLVGDFTSAQGTRTNIMVMDSDFIVVNSTIVPSDFTTNGPIYTVDSYRYGSNPSTNAIYFGGEFTQCTYDGSLYSRKNVARFDILDDGINIQSSNFSTWDADLDELGPVYSIHEGGSGRIVIAGEFVQVFETTTPQVRNRVASFTSGTGSLSAVPNNFNNSSVSAFDLNYIDGRFYYASQDAGGHIVRTSFLSTELAFTPPNSQGAYKIEELDDSLILVSWNHLGGGGNGPDFATVHRKSDFSIKTNHPYTDIGFPPPYVKSDMACYQGIYYNGGTYNINCFDAEVGIAPYLNLILGAVGGFPLQYDDILFQNEISNLIIVNGVLFVSFKNLISAEGSSRLGTASYCLPPDRADSFIVPDTLICQGETQTYSIPAANGAEGYFWEYSGQGVDMELDPAPENSTTTITPSLNINFLDDFQEGTLTVTPFTRCQNNLFPGDTVFGKPNSINIWLDNAPNALAGLDTILTCAIDTILLQGFSDSSNVSYSWKELNQTSYQGGQDTLVADSAYYILKVENVQGCASYDTVFVDEDKILPIVSSNLGPHVLTCADTTIMVGGSCSNTSDTLSWWKNLSNGDSLQNPLSANEAVQYQFFTQDTINGCIGSATPIIVSQDLTLANIYLQGYPSYSPLVSVDEITCINDSIDLIGYTDFASDSVYFTDATYTLNLGDSINVTAGGTYYIMSVNSANGCLDTSAVVIVSENTVPPVVILPTGVSSINCSNDSLILNGSSLNIDNNLQWTGFSISPSQNPVTIYNPGSFYLTATDTSNGCTHIDSLQINSDNSIDVIVSADTTACDQDLVTVTSSYVGIITGINYLWNNSDSNSSSTYTAGTDTLAIVEIFGDAGCYGTDTIRISTPPFPVINFQGFQPCGDGGTGYIVANPISGWAPFQYSSDGGANFQSNPTLDSLGIGTHTILVQDTLNCLYQFQAEISDTSQVVQPDFLISTYNQQSDTLIAIDVSSPTPDSTVWTFPTEIIYLGDENGSPLFLLPDTGNFDITLDAYYGTCVTSLTKQITVTEFDTTVATLFNQNGIKSIELYPNPNDGSFTIEVVFYKKQNASISVYDMNSNEYSPMFFDNVDLINEQVVLSAAAQNGTYVLQVIGEFDVARFTFILNK